jgi:4-hydroxybutyrate CoA-transferase
MDWREEYKRRLSSAEDAMELVRDGDLVAIPIAGPRVLPRALVRRADGAGRIDLRLGNPLSDPGFLKAEAQERFGLEFELFIGDFSRFVVDEGRGTYMPNLFSLNFKDHNPEREERREIDVFLTSVTPPDDEGYVQFGAHNWNKRTYVRNSKKTIAEVDPGLRPVCGDNKVHVTEIDRFVEIPAVSITREMVDAWLRRVDDDALRAEYYAIVDELKNLDRLILVGPAITRYTPLQVRRFLGLADPPEVARTISGFVSEIIPDGACIQIGVGEPSMYLPKAGAFDDKVDLGLHTEMVAPGIAKLVDGGVFTGKHKTLHSGKAVASAWSGSDEEDLAILTDNPQFQTFDPEYVLDITRMSQNDNVHSINNALSIDLIGQINSESVFGPRMINGTGGQPEAHIAACLSKGGRAITLLPSTAMDGAVSRIVPAHDAGAIVTVPRYFADTIVTEYGVARLWGKNHRQRAEELISVAHPDFRADLRAQAANVLGSP